MVLGSLLRRVVHEEDKYDSDDCQIHEALNYNTISVNRLCYHSCKVLKYISAILESSGA